MLILPECSFKVRQVHLVQAVPENLLVICLQQFSRMHSYFLLASDVRISTLTSGLLGTFARFI